MVSMVLPMFPLNPILTVQDLPGEYSATLTINNLQKEDVGHENELVPIL
jgi:hypothetical protein